MTSRNRVIIDTDPGVDDTLALLLALAAKPEEIEVLLISVTYGNVEVQNCLRNVVSMFHVIEKELEWRRQRGQPEGFETLKQFKPIVAIGAEQPLEDQRMMADYFHGTDGLGGIHSSHPHLHPSETWQHLFDPPPTSTLLTSTAPLAPTELSTSSPLYTPSHAPSHDEILRLLRSNPPDTITIIAIGPLTNLALAVACDPETFLRAKEVVVMGGALAVPGNITPVAEFNTYADSIAAARVFALTSPRPASTLPPPAPAPAPSSPSTSTPTTTTPTPNPTLLYPRTLSRRLRLSLFPLDITTPHLLRRSTFRSKMAPLLSAGSPLAEWVDAFLSSTFHKISTLHPPVPNSLAATEAEEREREGRGEVALTLHDPLCVWYLLTHPEGRRCREEEGEGDGMRRWVFSEWAPEDIRVETAGQWTRGMCVVDRRDRLKMGAEGEDVEMGAEGEDVEKERGGKGEAGGEGDGEVIGDAGRWLDVNRGNRIWRAVKSPEPPGMEGFGKVLLERIFG